MDKLITLSEFLQLFPWTAEELNPGNVIEKLWHYDLAISDEQIWSLICNSNVINKESGTKPIQYQEKGNLLHGANGSEEWIEYPWEWVYAKWGKRVRKYIVSIISYNRAIYYIQRKEKGIRLYIYLGSTYKNSVHSDVINQFLDSLETKYERVIKGFERDVVEGQRIDTFQMTPELMNKLNKLLVPYHGMDTKLAAKLLKYILSADESELGRIRLIPLARAWNVDLDDMLSICLHACQFGHLQLSWDTICPHCRGVRQENPYLSQIPLSGCCEICEINYDTSKEGALEIVFHVHPSVREVKKIFYCTAEPYHKAHIKVQEHILPGTTRKIVADLPNATYRSRIIGKPDLPVIVKELSSDASHRQHWEMEITNPDNRPYTFVLEDQTFVISDFLKPQYLFNNQEFRRLFNDEHLPVGLNIDIGLQAVVFADVVQSTKLYQQLGDAKSFNMIRSFMKMIWAIVSKHRGVVIKMMGDGAMFAFNAPLDAFKSAIDLQKLSENSPDLKLRIAMNYGECIAVNFNHKIDYFGHMVNLASKLQGGSDPSDLIISEKCFDLDEIQAYLTEHHIIYEHCEVKVPSLETGLSALKLKARGTAENLTPPS